MSINYECDVCHGKAQQEDLRGLSLMHGEGDLKNAGLRLSIHLCSQKCKDKLVKCIKNFLALYDEGADDETS